jgi:hypothetical protein
MLAHRLQSDIRWDIPAHRTLRAHGRWVVLCLLFCTQTPSWAGDCLQSIEEARWCPQVPGTTINIPYYFGKGLNSSCTAFDVDCQQLRIQIHSVMDEWELASVDRLDYAFSFQFSGLLADEDSLEYGIVFVYEDLGNATTCDVPGEPPASAPTGCDPAATLDEWADDYFPVLGYCDPRSELVPGSDLRSIYAACVALNDYADWGEEDRPTTLRHEVGHALGIGHTFACDPNLMEPGDVSECGAVYDIDELTLAAAQCLYGGGDLNPNLWGFEIFDIDKEKGTALVKSRCDGTELCAAPLAKAELATPRTYELALSDHGGEYAVFANLTEDQWTDNIYTHVFTSSYGSAMFRMRVYEDAVLVGEAYSTYPARITGQDPSLVPSPEGTDLLLEVASVQKGEATLRFRVNAPGEVRLDLFDVTGRRVRSLFSGQASSQWQAVSWDGRNDERVAVSSGVFFARLVSGDENLIRKFIWTR